MMEFRLVWHREGHPHSKARRFRSRHAAEAHLAKLLAYDPHFYCDHETGPCNPLPPIDESGVRLEQREVTRWQPVGPKVEFVDPDDYDDEP